MKKLSGAERGRQLSDFIRPQLCALHVCDVCGGRALSEPLDERMDRSGLADREHFDATVSEIARVAATTELLRTLPG